MIRKALAGIGLLTVGSYLMFGTSVGSYARTGVAEVQRYVFGQVPIEFEIRRARQLASELGPDVQKAMKNIAEEEVKIDRLGREIDQISTKLDQEKIAILSLRDHLNKGQNVYVVSGRSYSSDEMKAELHRRFASYKRAEEALKTKEATLASREEALRAAQSKFDELVAAQESLESELAALEAKHTLVQATKTANRFVIDDSRLSQTQQLIDELNDRLTVETRLAEQQGDLIKRIPVEDLPPSNLDEQIDRHFGLDHGSSEKHQAAI
ncbi:hypothetical protein Pan216_37520 [Planctomycetes bacterium Pan216]|uniref:Chromosome partition protein Smc n=1 Tax=Kolteria novifilia TaxID=2527975 RepID=A0A518B7C0_9BACT|nr:hypothetical protein Pan216_37520 [Planctomycetes bacterium Pan216]